MDGVNLPAQPAEGKAETPPHWTSGIVAVLAARRHALASAAGVVVLAVLSFAIYHMAREVDFQDVLAALRGTPWHAVGWAVLLTAVSFLSLSVYDVEALAHIGHKVPYPVVALTSFCSYAVGNTAGFGPLTGGAIRFRFYAPMGLEPECVGKVVVFVTAAFGLGLTAVTALSLLVAADDVAGVLSLPPLALQGGAVLAIGGLLALVVRASRPESKVALGRVALRLPRPRIMLGQFAATAVDIVACAGILWVLLPEIGLGFPAFVTLYAVAIGLGVLSHVPAGLGVFETIMIATLGRLAPMDQILGALVLYRVIYHILPLLLATVLVSIVETRRAMAGPAASKVVRSASQMAPPVISAMTLVLGAMLIFSGVTPALPGDLDILDAWIALPIVESAHFLASVLGLALVIVARGLAFRLDGAWWAAIAAAALAVVLSVLKAVALGEAIVLSVLVLALLATRAEFSRPASLLHQTLTPPWLAAIATIVISAFVLLFLTYQGVDYTDDLWWQFEISNEAPRSLRALLAVSLGAGSFAIWNLLRPAPGRTHLPSPQEIDRALAILETQPMAAANLLRMGDKSLMFSEDGKAFIMYGRQGRSWVALFDPVGARDSWPELVWRFVETARASGGRAAFYQVVPENLALYADAGLSAFKLGEEARIPLADFSLSGSKRYGLRQTVSRCSRDGLVFSLLSPDEIAAEMDRLEEISDAWLASHRAREKRFSLGAFDRSYVQSQTVAVLRRADQIVAFATVMTTALTEEATIDLMRFDDEAPRSAMEFLFIRLMEHFKAAGYDRLHLGMAPLSGLSSSPAAPFWHRVGRAVFEHGERFYNFQGLRAFKAKFQPEWQPRYLAVAGGLNPALALADIATLIGGGLKGVVGK
ncbi:bifunctional lysylphosphatidylglycerol flippase/synthetase MprF [Rhodospirillum rubrum]|uniref:Phosphatidylglycerol lysyltransferase n=1 Tax=Rhodospirillum rubrum (strain ATCC 11170 / ATH 1.1.1 / DSM 467 / LMG 4362 / NCIMB 8255 / S1) TaxID=269796 RepID=Q2RQB8_RHORT|nr:bifunctional lysylphosphatidylglycerol flippase/synthetase MprF [Rhodospirillum rubrum]ABC23677.1 conserved hypothetical protein [Rhodospirillum rubrum ATCC 11170]AEO49415.1 hypothetical protein F11_14765 [Rhodospirillum rubrum F11]MBK5955353.1 hypothetical protein [Rhodospirillum rubrum]QXG79637.1 bifunctional lysylphosphatidylglycerol flippase/synthetase MprF [Rhodospirillum rubrum]HAQ00060.1 bifunctional lysylphosphatidylglycerol flippase/synthetase MprF [Rhodospirillum rubrum]